MDGLRAVAVGVVLLFHGGVSWLPGGFLGVDLFFVLSGFLITSLLLLEWDSTGRLNLAAFWGRRARRLLPALLLVLLALAAVGALRGSDVATTIRTDGLAALFYVSNWWFIVSGSTYADQFAEPSPLQHTWSLAIEEQWYLILPLVLVLLLPRVREGKRLAVLFGSAALVSAGWMLLLAPTAGGDPARVYYGTDTRVQSLLVGGALACLAPLVARWRPAPVLALVGVLVSVAAFTAVTYRTEWMYRGGYLLVAISFAAVIADVVSRPHGGLGRLLSWRPLVAIGGISYGLYLWHWPTYLLLSPQQTGLSGIPLLTVRIVATLILAVVSYRLVELPIRRGLLLRLEWPRRLAIAAAASTAVAAALVVAPSLAADDQQRSLAALAADAEATPAGAGTTSAVVVGDSQALALVTQFDPADGPGLAPSLITEYGCGLIPFEAAVGNERLTLPDKCYEYTAAEIERRVAAQVATVGVLMAGSWEQYDRWDRPDPIPYTDPRWSQELTDAYLERLEILDRHTEEVAVILNHCHGAEELDLPLDLQFAAGRYPPVVNDPNRIAAVNRAALDAAAKARFPVAVIDPNPVLCPDGYTEELDGVRLRTDGLHLTEEGAALVWRYVAPRLAALDKSSST